MAVISAAGTVHVALTEEDVVVEVDVADVVDELVAPPRAASKFVTRVLTCGPMTGTASRALIVVAGSTVAPRVETAAKAGVMRASPVPPVTALMRQVAKSNEVVVVKQSVSAEN